jgi:hypothetical protein
MFKLKSLLKKVIKVFFGLAFMSVVVLVVFISSLYLLTPANLQKPKPDHAHFRMQYIYRGVKEDFGLAHYQVDYVKDVCSSDLTNSPIHFHDNKDQIVHLHWQRITGGQVLKFYGLNKIGGLDDKMGFKIDDIAKLQYTALPTHSNSLPKPTKEDSMYIYSGDYGNYKKRTEADFINQDLETFFGQESSFRRSYEKNIQETSFIDYLTPIVFAHNQVEHTTESEAKTHELESKKQEELKQINNFLGNVIIFVQQSEPTNEQINDRFVKLTELSSSTCGG